MPIIRRMDRAPRTPLDRWLNGLPGWIFLLGGTLLIGGIVLIRPLMVLQRLSWEAQLLSVQAKQIEDQRTAYAQFAKALDERDPVLLERLAYVYLHLQPKGRSVMWDAVAQYRFGPLAEQQAELPAGELLLIRGSEKPQARQAIVQAETNQTVEGWLHKPLPKVGEDFPEFQPHRSRLAHLASGLTAMTAVAAGAILILAGLLWSDQWTERSGAEAGTYRPRLWGRRAA